MEVGKTKAILIIKSSNNGNFFRFKVFDYKFKFSISLNFN